MTVHRLEHVGVVVDDLAAAIAFFTALGLRVQGQTTVEGDWVDRVNGLDGVRADLAILETSDGRGCLELTQYRAPARAPGAEPPPPANAPGLRHVLFVVDDVATTLAALREHGGELVGTVEDYRETYRLCYVRGPAGIIVELAEELVAS